MSDCPVRALTLENKSVAIIAFFPRRFMLALLSYQEYNTFTGRRMIIPQYTCP
jgi:hypothetical protein